MEPAIPVSQTHSSSIPTSVSGEGSHSLAVNKESTLSSLEQMGCPQWISSILNSLLSCLRYVFCCGCLEGPPLDALDAALTDYIAGKDTYSLWEILEHRDKIIELNLSNNARYSKDPDGLIELVKQLPGVRIVHLPIETTPGLLKQLRTSCPNINFLNLSAWNCLRTSDADKESIMREVAQFPVLYVLECYGDCFHSSTITDEDFKILAGGLKKLISLDLPRHSSVTGEGIALLVEANPHLKTLNLEGCVSITDENFERIAKAAKKLEALCLNNLGTRQIPEGILRLFLTNNSQLKVLYLADQQEIVLHLSNEIKSLSLQYVDFSSTRANFPGGRLNTAASGDSLLAEIMAVSKSRVSPYVDLGPLEEFEALFALVSTISTLKSFILGHPYLNLDTIPFKELSLGKPFCCIGHTSIEEDVFLRYVTSDGDTRVICIASWENCLQEFRSEVDSQKARDYKNFLKQSVFKQNASEPSSKGKS
jgi:hypothetical protein